jgi:hypothetical protein
MPRIPERITDAVFYLYRNREDALAGRNPGGTGFIVRYNTDWQRGIDDDVGQFYAVTNYHVAGYWPTIRLNTLDGGVDVIELASSGWHFIPGKYDVAVTPITLDRRIHDTAAVGTHMFATSDEDERRGGVALGDDVFMIGLFFDHGGTTANIPSARFGNISMLTDERAKIRQTATGYDGVSFVIDMHSRTGFSGSPVFAYRTFGSDLDVSPLGGHEFQDIRIDAEMTMSGSFTRPTKGSIKVHTLFKLLGIHWGQFPERWELGQKNDMSEARKLSLASEGGYVEGFSGMTCVIPAWQIMEVLDLPSLKGPRDDFFSAAEKR